jgi:hypothetical protein
MEGIQNVKFKMKNGQPQGMPPRIGTFSVFKFEFCFPSP